VRPLIPFQGFSISAFIETIFPNQAGPSPEEVGTLPFSISIGLAVSVGAVLTLAMNCPAPADDLCRFYGHEIEAVREAVRAMMTSALLFTFALTLFIAFSFLRTAFDAGWMEPNKRASPQTAIASGGTTTDAEGAPTPTRVRPESGQPKIIANILALFLDLIVAFICGGLYYFGQGLEVVDLKLAKVLEYGAVIGVRSVSLGLTLVYTVIRGLNQKNAHK